MGGGGGRLGVQVFDDLRPEHAKNLDRCLAWAWPRSHTSVGLWRSDHNKFNNLRASTQQPRGLRLAPAERLAKTCALHLAGCSRWTARNINSSYTLKLEDVKGY